MNTHETPRDALKQLLDELGGEPLEGSGFEDEEPNAPDVAGGEDLPKP